MRTYVSVLFCAMGVPAMAQILPPNYPAPVDKGFVVRPGGNPANPADRAYWHVGLSTSAGAPIWDDFFAINQQPLADMGINMTYAFGTCFGGGMVQDIVQLPQAANPNVRINATSAAKWYQPAYYPQLPRVPAPPVGPNNSNSDWVDWYVEMSRPGRGIAGGAPTHQESAVNAWWNDPFGTTNNPIVTHGPDEPAGSEEAQFRETVPGLANALDHTRDPQGAHRFAVLYSGKPNAFDQRQILAAYDMLTNGYGYNVADIYVLYGNGPGALPVGSAPNLAGRVFPATLNFFTWAITNIQTVEATSANPQLDQFFFLANDHGTAWNDLMSPDRSRYLDVPKTPGGVYQGTQGIGGFGPLTDWSTLPYYVPTPPVLMLMGLGIVGGASRRRRA